MLLCRIGKHGYYIEWDERYARAFARDVSTRMSNERVTRMVMAFTLGGIFDTRMLHECNVLTSRAIQEDYFRAVKRRKKR
jgi:hypothetical protein